MFLPASSPRRGSTRVVAIGGEEFRLAIRTTVARIDDVNVMGEATDATAAVIVCALARPAIVMVDAAVQDPEDAWTMGRIEDASPAARVFVVAGEPTATLRTALDDASVQAIPGP